MTQCLLAKFYLSNSETYKNMEKFLSNNHDFRKKDVYRCNKQPFVSMSNNNPNLKHETCTHQFEVRKFCTALVHSFFLSHANNKQWKNEVDFILFQSCLWFMQIWLEYKQYLLIIYFLFSLNVVICVFISKSVLNTYFPKSINMLFSNKINI